MFLNLCLLLALLAPSTQQSFPSSWQGRWLGPATVSSPGKPLMRFEMELKIGATDDPARWQWTITYISNGQRQVRPYELVIVNAETGDYQVDEKQGIIIPSRLMDDSLVCEFEIENVRILGSYRKEGNDLVFQLTTVDPTQSKDSGGRNGVPTVKSFRVLSLQRAVLKRQ